jgi:hypothetical protein
MSAISSNADSLGSSNSQSSAVNIANNAKLTGLVKIARECYEQSANNWFQIFDELEQEGLISTDFAQYEEEKALVKEYLETLHELNGHRLQLDLTEGCLEEMRAMYDRYEAGHKSLSEFFTVSKMPLPPVQPPTELRRNMGEFEAVAKKQLKELQKFARESLEAGRSSDLKLAEERDIWQKKLEDERNTGEEKLNRKIEEERADAESKLTRLQEELKSRLMDERKAADENLEAARKSAEDKLDEEGRAAAEKLAGEKADAEQRWKEERELGEKKLADMLKGSRDELEREIAEKSKGKVDFNTLEESFRKAKSEFAEEKERFEKQIQVIPSEFLTVDRK